MSKVEKVLEEILFGRSDANIDFSDLCKLLERLGFYERIKGSHHIFSRPGVEEIINIQPKGNKAKAYQVKQVRNIILKYRLGVNDE
jgi:predicted RNA binding protein YcfA (HicA-like mRNA interferase family)